MDKGMRNAYTRRSRDMKVILFIFKVWDSEEIKKLVDLASEFDCNWTIIAANMPFRTESQCSQRYFFIYILGTDVSRKRKIPGNSGPKKKTY